MIAYERRASTVIYNLLAGHPNKGLIFLPANVCPIVPIALCKARRDFEFVDISPTTLCIDHEKLVERWMHSVVPPAGLIYVRTYGAIFDTDDVFDQLKKLTPDALIIDDRCTCAPSFEADTLAENVDAVIYSTGYAKYADIGFGGYAFIRDESLYRHARLPFNEQHLEVQTRQYRNALLGQHRFIYLDNDWLDFEKPAIDWVTYRNLVEEQVRKASVIKQSINHIYVSKLPPEIQLAPSFHSWRFNIHIADKPALLAAIEKAGLFASGHYEPLDGLFGSGSGEKARTVHQHTVNLFNDYYFDVERAELLADLILNIKNIAPSPLDL